MDEKIIEVRRKLKDKIESEGKVIDADFLSVDNFLNHQGDTGLMDDIGEAIARKFVNEYDQEISKVVTAASSGIPVAYSTARSVSDLRSKSVDFIYAKKKEANTMNNGISKEIESPTGGSKVELYACRDYLEGKKVLVTDDFLFSGTTSEALTEICEEAGADVVGYAYVISKAFSEGYDQIKEYGKPIFILSEIEGLDPEKGKVYVSKV